MKKFLSVLFSIVILVGCVSTSSFSATANTKKTAEEIVVNQSVGAYVDSATKEFWVKFEPAYSGYYEFVCTAPVYNGMVLGSIFDASEEVLMMNACNAGNGDFITAAELEGGDTYYFVLEGDGSAYATDIIVRPHNHFFNHVENYPAIFDANEPNNNTDGGNYVFCAYCNEYVTNALYFSPAKMSIKTKKFTYNGKKKTTTVTVTDRLGNIIPATEYRVSYKSNTNPGTATVTVTFTNVNYCGSMKTSFTIVPKKLSISALKSPKKKQLKVTWKKDKTISGYQVQYSTSSKFSKSKTKTVNVSKKSTSKTVSKLKSKKKYYVRIRSYKTSQGKKLYGSWSKVKSIKIK